MRAAASARLPAVLGSVFALALALRLGLVVGSRGGPTGAFSYDPGVYYTAADALTFGRLPYRDFVLLHPPGLMLTLTPFAALGRLTTDHLGFIVANTAFSIIGAVNATLVVHIARRLGLSLVAAALGGTFYAVWYGAISTEICTRLEPLGTLAFLCGLLALTGRDRASPRSMGLAGVALGAAASVKIWWIVPLAIVAVWLLRSASRRPFRSFAAGCAAAFVVIDLPFLIAAPGAMWRMVVTDQIGRHTLDASPLSRLRDLSSVHSAFPTASIPVQIVTVSLAGVLVSALAVAAWRSAVDPLVRVLVVIVAAQLAVLLAAPSFFPFYSGYLTAASSLVVAAAAQRAEKSGAAARTGRAVAVLAVAASAALSSVTLFVRPLTQVAPFPAHQLAASIGQVRCVMTDSPIALIELNALSRDLADGCPNWVDVTGRTYDTDASAGSSYVPRAENRKWQTDLRRYLLSGDATIIIRSATGYAPSTLRAIDRLPVLSRAPGFAVHRVPRPAPVPRLGSAG